VADASSPRFQIRPASTADAAAILDCLRVAFEPYCKDYTAVAYADTILTPEMLAKRMHHSTLFVAVDTDGGVLGTIGYGLADSQEGHIRGMAVRPAHHGGGIAGALLARVESELRARGYARVSLDTTGPLRRAIRFYERSGYRRSGKVVDFFGMPLFEFVKDL